VAVAAFALSAQAALINVDFNGGSYQNGVPNGPTHTGPAVIGSTGDYWNGFIDDAPSIRLGEPLLDVMGMSTTVALDYNVGFNYDSMSWGTSPFVTAGSSVADLMVEFVGAGAGSTGTLTLHGLTTGQYDVYLYSAPDSGAAQSRVTTFRVNGLTASVGPNQNASTLIEGTNYLHLVPTIGADGVLDISFDGGAGEGDLNGFQIRPASVSSVPFFSVQPTPATATVFQYGTVRFSALADGTQPITLQWRHGNADIPGATNASLILKNISAADAGSYTLVASNAFGVTTSQPATIILATAPAHFVANFDFDCGGNAWPGTYSGPGVLGTGTFWNPITGPNAWATGTYVNSTSVADNGTADTGVSLTLVTAGNWAGAGKSPLLDDYACSYTASGQPFTFNCVPDGLYSLVLFGVDAPWSDPRGTIFTINGVSKATVNALIDPDTFVEGDNYVRFDNLIITNGTITGTWAPNPVPHGGSPNGEGDFNGAQLQRVGDVTAFVAPSISTQPGAVTVYEQRPASFTVSSSGTPAPTYQWQKSAVNIAGATTNTYTIPSVTVADAADYRVVVQNVAGSITSSVAHLTVLAAPSAPLPGSFDAAVLTNNPIAFWRLSDASGTQLLYDSVGTHVASNQNVTLGAAGPESPTYPGFPAKNSAASFDGTTSAATTGASLMNALTNFTLMGWINPAGPNNDRVGIFGQNDAVEFGYNDTDGVYLWTPASIAGWVNPKSGPDGFAINQWYFIALVADGRDITIYVNGTPRGQVANVGQPTGFSGYGFNIGGGGILDATGNHFNGLMADVAVFDRAISGQQINNLFNVAAGTIAPSIYSPPISQAVLQGFPAKFSVAASGAPLSYQWQAGPANGPFTNLVDSSSLIGTRSATLTLPNASLNQALSYRVNISNSLGSVTSEVVSLTVDALAVPWTLGFDFDCSEGGAVGTYTGLGVLGNGTYWNNIPGPSSWEANTYTSSGGLLDNGLTDTKISLVLVTGGSWSYNPVGNQLLDDFATADANGKSFTFVGLPDGRYNLAVFAVNGGWHDRGTIVTVNGQALANTNASSATFVEGDNYVMFRDITVTGGVLIGTYAANPNSHGGGNTEGDFSGAQLQFVGAALPLVTLNMQTLANGQIQLQWSQGKLMQTSDLTSGAWSPVPNASSPYTTSAAGPRMFYRVQVQP
jgi:hypothetical protein